MKQEIEKLTKIFHESERRCRAYRAVAIGIYAKYLREISFPSIEQGHQMAVELDLEAEKGVDEKAKLLLEGK